MSTEDEEETAGLKNFIAKAFTPLSAYTFMAFVLPYFPCFIVLVALRHEFGIWKWAGVAVAYHSVLAWVVAFVIFQGGRILGL